jgi:hypothetical protein
LIDRQESPVDEGGVMNTTLYKELDDKLAEGLAGGWSDPIDTSSYLNDWNGNGSIQDEFVESLYHLYPPGIDPEPKLVGKIPDVNDPKYVNLTQYTDPWYGYSCYIAGFKYQYETNNRGRSSVRVVPLSA